MPFFEDTEFDVEQDDEITGKDAEGGLSDEEDLDLLALLNLNFLPIQPTTYIGKMEV